MHLTSEHHLLPIIDIVNRQNSHDTFDDYVHDVYAHINAMCLHYDGGCLNDYIVIVHDNDVNFNYDEPDDGDVCKDYVVDDKKDLKIIMRKLMMSRV